MTLLRIATRDVTVCLDGLGELRLSKADSHHELDAVHQFRVSTYRDRSDLDVDADDPALDRDGHSLTLRHNGEIVACARVLPLPHPGALVGQFDHPLASNHIFDAEVGRLAAARKQSAVNLVGMLGLGSRWIQENTDHTTYMAYCRKNLAASYGRIGAVDLGVDKVMPLTGRTYRLVAGRFDVTAATALEALPVLAAAAGRNRWKPGAADGAGTTQRSA